MKKIKYTILELIKKIKINCKVFRKLVTDDELKLFLEYIYIMLKKNINILKENIEYREKGISNPLMKLKRGDVV